MAKFLCKKNTYANAGISTRFLIVGHVLATADHFQHLEITFRKEIEAPVGTFIFHNRTGNFCQITFSIAWAYREATML